MAAAGNKPLRVLIVEDSEFDARMLVNMLRKGGYEPTYKRVETADEMLAALKAERWDVLLSDYNLPTFSAPQALALVQQSGIDIPFIIVSGGIGEDIAVASMKAGAHDYLMKGNLARLAVAVERELREAEVRAARRQAEESLRQSERRYRQLWESATDAVLLMDENLVISFANPAVREVLGRAPEELTGKPLTDLGISLAWGPRTVPVDREAVNEVVRAKLRALEGRARRPDGAEVALGIAFNAVELGGQRSIVGFFRDITQQRRVEAELRENEEQFRVAREIQQRLFPARAPIIPGFDVAGASHPAAATGGDYFDYLGMCDGTHALVVGDVTGHGLGPALLMAETRAFLRLLVLNRQDVGEILTRANRALSADVDYEHYVTLLFAQLDPQRRELRWANAGHIPGYVLDASGAVKAELKRSGLPLGLKEANTYTTQPPVPLVEGDVLILPTDGIEESPGPDGELFGRPRLLETVRAARHRPAAEVVRAVLDALQAFTGRELQEDDVTLVVARVLAPGA
jgi:PAS domain S-box-containing protein